MKLLRKIIFWSHLLAGLIGGVVIFLMSATGVILMYEHQMVEYAERGVREVVPPSANARRASKIPRHDRPGWRCAMSRPLRLPSAMRLIK